MSTRVVRGVARLRLAEDAHAIGDRLGARHGRAAVGEGAQEEERGDAEDQSTVGMPEREGVGVRRLMGEVADRLAYEPEDDEQGHVEDEEVGRDGEDAPGLSDAPQVAVGQHEDEGDAHRHRHPRLPAERGSGRDDGVRAGRNRDRDRDGVADQQRRAGHLRNVRTEVVTADDVGAARLGIRADDVPVAHGHDGQYRKDCGRHGRDYGEGRQPGDGHQYAEHLLGGVGGRGHDVR